jgi:hypothetical protein
MPKDFPLFDHVLQDKKIIFINYSQIKFHKLQSGKPLQGNTESREVGE